MSICVIIRVPRYFWWLCTLCEFIDASTDACEEEEAEVYEEEEEPCATCTNCVNCTNQGKLILVQVSKDTIATYLFREPFPFQVLFLQSFTFRKVIFTVHLCLSFFLLQVTQGLV